MAAQLRRKYFGIRQFSSRDLAVQHDEHHPCWKEAHFLPCTRPPDVMRHLSRPQRRGTFGPSQRRAFVATRSGLQTMPSGGHEHDEDTAAAASFGDVRPPAPQAQSVIRPRDGRWWPEAHRRVGWTCRALSAIRSGLAAFVRRKERRLFVAGLLNKDQYQKMSIKYISPPNIFDRIR